MTTRQNREAEPEKLPEPKLLKAGYTPFFLKRKLLKAGFTQFVEKGESPEDKAEIQKRQEEKDKILQQQENKKLQVIIKKVEAAPDARNKAVNTLARSLIPQLADLPQLERLMGLILSKVGGPEKLADQYLRVLKSKRTPHATKAKMIESFMEMLSKSYDKASKENMSQLDDDELQRRHREYLNMVLGAHTTGDIDSKAFEVPEKPREEGSGRYVPEVTEEVTQQVPDDEDVEPPADDPVTNTDDAGPTAQ